MKSIGIILILSFLSGNLFSQETEFDKSYLKLIKTYESFMWSKEKKAQLNNKNFIVPKSIQAEILRAKSINASELCLRLFMDRDKRKKIFLKNDSLKLGIHFSAPVNISGIIFRRLNNQCSDVDYKLFKADYLIRGRITAKDSILYNEPNVPSFSYYVIKCKAIINDIAVGDEVIKVGDEIEFQFGDHWYKNKNHQFKIGDEYFITLNYRYEGNGILKLFPIVYLDKNEGYFPIIKNQVIDETDSYGFGKTFSWQKIKDYYTELVGNILSWQKEK